MTFWAQNYYSCYITSVLYHNNSAVIAKLNVPVFIELQPLLDNLKVKKRCGLDVCHNSLKWLKLSVETNKFENKQVTQ